MMPQWATAATSLRSRSTQSARSSGSEPDQSSQRRDLPVGTHDPLSSRSGSRKLGREGARISCIPASGAAGPSGPISIRPESADQLHFDLLARMKLLTEFTTLAASGMTVASCAGEGLDGSALIAFAALSIDVLMAFVSLGKSLPAELTSAVAALWTFSACVLKALTLLLGLRLVSPPIAS